LVLVTSVPVARRQDREQRAENLLRGDDAREVEHSEDDRNGDRQVSSFVVKR
jgi:hypothetical protein